MAERVVKRYIQEAEAPVLLEVGEPIFIGLVKLDVIEPEKIETDEEILQRVRTELAELVEV